MIFRLEIENFYSIREPQTIDLIAPKSATKELGRLASIGPGLTEMAPKVVAFFGPNASGKSNVLRALSFLSWFIGDGFSMPPDKPLPYSRFKNRSSSGEPTRLAVWFTGPSDPRRIGETYEESAKYCYELTLGGEAEKPVRILFESLKFWPAETNRRVTLFQRDSEDRVKAHRFFALKGYQSALQAILRPNVSVISTLSQMNHKISTVFRQFASLVVSNIFIEKSELEEDALARLYGSAPDLLKELNREIERIDLGIRNLELVPGQNGPYFAIHHVGLTTPLWLTNESHGTRLFIRIFPYLFDALSRGGVAVIDELDLSIHPLVLPEILSWFYSQERNPHDAQLWITSQGASLLEELTKEEIFFCEKNAQSETSVFALRDVLSVRRTDNYYRKYLSGVYGAVPQFG